MIKNKSLIPICFFVIFPVHIQAQDNFESIQGSQNAELEGLENATPNDNVEELDNNSSKNSSQSVNQQDSSQSLENESSDNSINSEGELGASQDVNFGTDGISNVGNAENQSNLGSDQNQNIGNVSGQNQAGENAAAGSDQGLQNPSKSNESVENLGGNSQGSAPVDIGSNQIGNDAQSLMQEISSQSAVNQQTQPLVESSLDTNQSNSQKVSSTDHSISAPPIPSPNEFSGAPPVPGTLRQVSEGEAPQEYFVQPGDTLFDICDQLLDEPGYWPKLWSLNPDIKNPHFIFPNMKLRFYPGDDETPPYLQVVSEEEVIPIDMGQLNEEQLVAEKVEFEIEPVQTEEALTEVIGIDGVEGDFGDFISAGRAYQSSSIQLQIPGFIFREEREAVGFVIGGSAGEISVGPGQKIMVEDVEGLQQQTLYTILRKGEEILDLDSGNLVGYKYYFIANARVQKKIEESIFIAVVENTRLSVMPDDIVVSYLSTIRTAPAIGNIGALTQIKARVVGFQYFNQEIGGLGNFAFLDKGISEGVSPGMYVPVFGTPGNLTSSFGNAGLPEDYKLIGILRIVDITDAGSVGYIVHNNSEIRIGDRTGSG